MRIRPTQTWTPRQVAAFLRKIRPAGVTAKDCILWAGSTYTKGYGQYQNGLAHRAAYEMFIGPIPPDKLVCHRCDVPLCVNPDHLFLGSHQENSLDARDKGRAFTGEKNGRCKLSDADVACLRQDYQEGWTQMRIAKEYNISQTQVSRLTRGEQRTP